MRKIEFVNGEFYHIYNRGVDKRDIFLNENDYKRFILSINFLNDKNNGLMHIWKDNQRILKLQKTEKVQLREFPKLNLENLERKGKLVEFIAYCLNGNHFHFILKQVADKGIIKFMQKLGTSYTMYFNKKYNRSGALFQGKFKSIHIDSNEYLLYLSAYINKNNFIVPATSLKLWNLFQFVV